LLTKPVYGGSALAEYAPEAPGAPLLATLRPRAFAPAVREDGGAAEVVPLAVPGPGPEPRARVVETVREVSEGPRLKTAPVVVSGGRGLGGPEHWHYVEELAAALGAAVGATRAVTDAGWVPSSLQVGLTGTTVTPDLYVALGISGAVQHIAGCSGARTIVAINRDPEANIFRYARYGVVGDLQQVLPAMIDRVRELRGG
jgi:electron transfer flavoprotein alpha subunit